MSGAFSFEGGLWELSMAAQWLDAKTVFDSFLR